MDSSSTWIAAALAPGVALTAVIFYNATLQNRILAITGRIRELTGEGRQLRGAADGDRTHASRLASIRRQVDLLNRRTQTLRRAAILVYLAFLGFVVTVLAIAVSFVVRTAISLPVYAFTGSFLFLAVAAVLSSAEMYLSQQTVDEDIRSSLD